ncbi:hypothetical protein SRABI106_03462 [Rahnella aquatilis]|nr:hypothetical protein SRABI106_03462 [Rahnella aquatilis]
MIRVILVFLAHEREDHVVSVEVAGGFEQLAALEFHAFTQVEGIGFTVCADLPAFRQTRHQFCSTDFEIHQTVINWRSAGIHGSARCIKLRVELLRRAFGAVNQRFSTNAAGDG